MRCTATTKKGKPCQGGAIPGTGLCGPHFDQSQRPSQRPSANPDALELFSNQAVTAARKNSPDLQGPTIQGDWLDDDDVMLGYIAEAKRIGLWKG